MRICIFGAGAMGTSLGAALTEAGIACDLVTRDRAHVDALRKHGATLCLPFENRGRRRVRILRGQDAAPIFAADQKKIPVSALLPEEMAGRYDVIFLATGQQSNAELGGLCAYLSEDGALVTVQNGLPERGLRDIFGRDRIYGCALSWGAERLSPGVVAITSGSGFRFALGAYGGGDKLPQLKALLEQIGIVTTGDLQELRFAKLAINASFSTLSAITGLAFGELAVSHRTRVLSLMREVFSVARAVGCKKLPLNGHDLFRVFCRPWAWCMLPVAMRAYRTTRSGMLRAIAAGRRCDIDYVAGAAIRAGEEAGVPTPHLARAVAVVHEIENGLAEIAPESLSLLDETE